MFGNDLSTYLYGIILGLVAFYVIHSLYSVYYTPGVGTLYNSPVTQALFPNATRKLYPFWGYNRAGMYDGQPFTFGQGSFWPKSGQGYKPNRYGSAGASPSGGMRPTFPIPAETSIGYWGYTPVPTTGGSIDVYDQDASIPAPTSVDVGWWGY